MLFDRKRYAVLTAAAITVSLLAGCGDSPAETASETTEAQASAEETTLETTQAQASATEMTGTQEQSSLSTTETSESSQSAESMTSTAEQTISDAELAAEQADMGDEARYDMCTCGTYTHEEVNAFMEKAKKTLLAEDWKALASMCDYQITIGGRTYNTEEELANANITLTDEYKSRLKAEECHNMFANYEGIMLEKGEIWIAGYCDDNKPSAKLAITAINADVEGPVEKAPRADADTITGSRKAYADVLRKLNSGYTNDLDGMIYDYKTNENNWMKDYYFLLHDLDNDGIDELLVNMDKGKDMTGYFYYDYDVNDKTAYFSYESDQGKPHDSPEKIIKVWNDNKNDVVLYSDEACKELEKD